MEVEALWAQSVFRFGRAKLRQRSGRSSAADLGLKPLPFVLCVDLVVQIGVRD